MLGSDYPFPLGEHHPGKMIEAIEDMEQETKVCWEMLSVLKLFLCRSNSWLAMHSSFLG